MAYRIVITRAAHQAATLQRLLEDSDLPSLTLAAIEIRPTPESSEQSQAAKEIAKGQYDWVVFTSSNAVRYFKDLLTRTQINGPLPCRFAAQGPATARLIQELFGVRDILLPKEYVSESLLESLRALILKNLRVLIPSAADTRDVLDTGLSSTGATVQRLALYQNVPVPPNPALLAELRASREQLIFTFLSPSAVRSVVQMLAGDKALLSSAVLASIGPITSGALRELGLRVDIEAPDHSEQGLVQAIQQYIQRNRPTSSPSAH